MDLKIISRLTSGAALVLLVLYVFFPDLGIDVTAIALLVIAAFPWILPIVRKIELPGGRKIELREVWVANYNFRH